METSEAFRSVIVNTVLYEPVQEICEPSLTFIDLKKKYNGVKKLKGNTVLYLTKKRLLIICTNRKKQFNFFSIPLLLISKPSEQVSFWGFKYLEIWLKRCSVAESQLNFLSEAKIKIEFHKKVYKTFVDKFMSNWYENLKRRDIIIIDRPRITTERVIEANPDNVVFVSGSKIQKSETDDSEIGLDISLSGITVSEICFKTEQESDKNESKTTKLSSEEKISKLKDDSAKLNYD